MTFLISAALLAVSPTDTSVVTTLRSRGFSISDEERTQGVLVSTSNIVGGIIHESLVQTPKHYILLAV